MLSPKRTLAGSLAEKRTNKREAAVLQFAKQISACTWDFDVDGGAVGTISFGQSLPAGAIVTNIWTDEVTTVTGATDITLKAGSTALSGSINFTGAGDSGVKARSMAVADAVKLTSASEINIEIATAAATAGKVTFYMEWMIVPNTVA